VLQNSFSCQILQQRGGIECGRNALHQDLLAHSPRAVKSMQGQVF